MASTTKVDFSRLSTRLRNMEQVIKEEGPRILEQASEIGVTEMKRVIDTSTTAWGQFRASQGRPSAGRRETDTMYNAVTSTSTDKTAKWGWLNGYEQYFMAQENGTQRISAMHSLRDSKQTVLDEMPRLVRNAKQRIYRRSKRNSS